MNRKQRRKAEKAGVIEAFDPTTHFQVKYEIKAPGGLLRSSFPVVVAGKLEAASEADALRGIIVKLLDTFGFTPHDKAVAGVLGEVFNPLPKRLRGQIAYDIIEGLGLYIGTDEEDICDDPKCGAVLEKQLHPDPENAEPTSWTCDRGHTSELRSPLCMHEAEPSPDETLEDFPEYNGERFCGAPTTGDPVMIDVTRHAPECHVNREVDPERPERPLRPATYKTEEVIIVVNPRRFAPLNNEAIDPETGDVKPALEVPEAGGESVSTADADSEEPFVVSEEDTDDDTAGTADSSAGGQ